MGKVGKVQSVGVHLSAGESSGSRLCTRVTSLDAVYRASASAAAPQSSLGSASHTHPYSDSQTV